MTVTATPNPAPAGRAPRIEIAVTSTDGTTITSISMTRTALGATVPVRAQPTAGPSPRLVNDYEAPWGVPVTYTAVVTSTAGTSTMTSTAVTLTPDKPWAIHPTTTALSFCLDQATPAAAGVRTLGTVTRGATDTGNDVIGSPYRVYTKTGPRAAARTSLDITTTTLLEMQALIALITDLTPLLLRVPQSWGWAFEDGYYHVGDVDETRLSPWGADPTRIFTLPLERVEEPAGTQQADRTYANVLNDFSTYSAVRAGYASYTALLTDTRS